MEFTFHIQTQASFDPRKRKRIADAALDVHQPARKWQPDPPPKATKKLSRTRKAPTKLRKDRPVQASLMMDIWESILSFSSLERLLKLREISSTFHSALQNDYVWKMARHNQFGVSHPDPPTGLREMQYADLLVGVGCQGSGCDAKDTRRTYWGFRRRWCEVCLAENLSRVSQGHCTCSNSADQHKGRHAKEQLLMYDEASKCIPQVQYDSWGHYQWVGNHDHAPNWAALSSSQSVAYSKFDVRDMNVRIAEFMSTSPTETEIETWFSQQEAANVVYVNQLQKVERWVEEDRKFREKERAEIRDKRADFFKERALQMDPPLDADVLVICPSYDRSIRISKVPSEKSWQKLLPKICDEREEAETTVKRRKRRENHMSYRVFLKNNYVDIVEKRKDLCSREQRLVLDIADQVISETLTDPVGIQDSDLVNIIFRGIYDAYEKVEDSQKPANAHGIYQLIMDDARLVYTARILPILEYTYGPKRNSLIKALKCPGAYCRDTDQSWEFEELMQHIYETHRYQRGFQHLLITNNLNDEVEIFPWYCMEWPRNLPMLAMHQTGPAEWDIDDASPYVRAEHAPMHIKEQPVDDFLSNFPSRSPFEGMDFSDAILHTASFLNSADLSKWRQSMQVLELACARINLVLHEPITQQDVNIMVADLNQAGYGNLFDGHCCMICPRSSRNSTGEIASHNFIDLVQHYSARHCQGADGLCSEML